jgi:hypothetical protein
MPGPLDDLLANRDAIADVAHAITGLDGIIAVDEVDADPVPLTNMTTTALGRVGGTVTSSSKSRPWSVVIKVVQSPDQSPVWQMIPPDLHAQVLFDLPWRSEPGVYRSSFGDHLPDGMRLPRVYRTEDLDDVHLAIWMEDVQHRAGTWSDNDYGRAGTLLGRMWGRMREPNLPDDIELMSRNLRSYFLGRVVHGVLPDLLSDATWRHPVLADAADAQLRADLARLTDIVPSILDRLDALPQGATHGDACPQNLLRSADDDATIVAIDWQFVGLCSIGFDAGQVLAGHAESGDLNPDRYASVFESVLDGYLAGVREEGVVIDPADARFGAVGALVVRSVFTAIPLELLGSPSDTGLDRLIRDRCRYARFLVDLATAIA